MCVYSQVVGTLQHSNDTRGFLIAAMMIGLGCIAAALFIMVDVFLNNEAAYTWTGIATFIQCLLIFVRSVPCASAAERCVVVLRFLLLLLGIAAHTPCFGRFLSHCQLLHHAIRYHQPRGLGLLTRPEQQKEAALLNNRTDLNN